ncbi:sodium transporter [Clostridium novyi A str. 4570]|uniref:Sodium transporter n=1 Tax=Clostridium novyi A str. 4570 TaxID=1444290 RepID=A0AA88ZUW1_CLONO|nr:bile acid:sodium symporter family protein [Clostridium novyi]KGN02170.1 sodium transporter [Clostridium novyi A str. 4570]
MKYFYKVSDFMGRYLALLVIVMAGCSLLKPELFLPLGKVKVMGQSLTSLLIGVIMFGVGLTLNLRDFKVVFTRPKEVLIGCLAQFTVMPLVAFFIAKTFSLDPFLAVGLVLLGTCPGGTASNVMTFLAKGDVSLSVAMTMVSTLVAPILTPVLTFVLAGQWVEVNMMSMLMSILQVVVVPVGLGILAHKFIKEDSQMLDKILVLTSVLCILTIIAVSVAPNSKSLVKSGFLVIAAVCLHNWLGFLIGYLIAKVSGMDDKKKRAVSIEVGLQNSGLAVGLGGQFSNPICLLPAVVAMVVHQISGSLLASFFTRKDFDTEVEDNKKLANVQN